MKKLTLKTANEIGKANGFRVKNTGDDLRVSFRADYVHFTDASKYERTAYYTNDLQDAIDTGISMCEQANVN